MLAYIEDCAKNPHAPCVPGIHHIQDKFPGFEICDDAEAPIEFLCQQVRDDRCSHSLEKIFAEGRADLEAGKNPGLIITEHQDKISRLGLLSTRLNSSTFSGSVDSTVARYDRAAKGEYVNPILWPWERLNKVTRGIAYTDFVLYFGRPKNKKTFVLMYHALYLYLQGKHVLMYSKEMPEDEIWDRAICFLADLPYEAYNAGMLSPDEYGRLRSMAEFVKDMARDTHGRQQITCVSGLDAPDGSDTVAWLASMAKKHLPDVIIIDGVYLMASSSKSKEDHSKASAISRAVRAMAMRMRIPVIATIQANRKADKSGFLSDSDEIAFSDAFSQDATCMVRVVADKFRPICNLLLPGSRKFKLEGIQINAVPCSDFSYIQDIDQEMIERALAGDVDDPLAPPASARGKKGKAPRQTSKPDLPPAVSLDDIDM